MNFEQFAIAHGVDVSKIEPSARIQRVPTVEHPRSKNGAVLWDGSRGWVQNWERGLEVHWFDGEPKAFTEQDRKAWAQKKHAQQQLQAASWAKASQLAQSALMSCKPAEHGYLQFKGLKECKGLVMPDGALFVPMRNVETNALQGAQVIRWDATERKWIKKMMPGMRAKDAVFRIGPKTASETIFCEGYATGLSIELACRLMRLNAAVMVCFSAGNMVSVAGRVKGRRFVFADNDQSGVGEESAKKTGLPYCMADTVGFDANDVHVRCGIYALANLVMRGRRMAA